ncbi:hypothetical protein Ocin01_20142, partial [Orchesella cincta]
TLDTPNPVCTFPPSEGYDRKLQKGKIRLHLSARNVDRGKEKSDPYCLVSLSEDGGQQGKLGKRRKLKMKTIQIGKRNLR